jgi:hypothetical protein
MARLSIPQHEKMGELETENNHYSVACVVVGSEYIADKL